MNDFGFSSVVDIFDKRTRTWRVAALSQARYQLVATSIGGRLALFAAGLAATGVSAVVDMYDLSTNTWSTAQLSVARTSLAATSLGSRALFAGGQIPGPIVVNTVDIYDANTNTWDTAQLSVPRDYLTAATASAVALFAGGVVNAAASPTAQVDMFGCPGGSALNFTLGVCVVCPAGTYSAFSSCAPCAPGTFSTGNAAVCSNCPPGQPLLQLSTDISFSGSFCPTSSMTTPTLCPGGSYCSLPGLSAPTAKCNAKIACFVFNPRTSTGPQGSFCSGGNQQPFPCSPGFYCPTVGLTQPTSCPPSMYMFSVCRQLASSDCVVQIIIARMSAWLDCLCLVQPERFRLPHLRRVFRVRADSASITLAPLAGRPACKGASLALPGSSAAARCARCAPLEHMQISTALQPAYFATTPASVAIPAPAWRTRFQASGRSRHPITPTL